MSLVASSKDEHCAKVPGPKSINTSLQHLSHEGKSLPVRFAPDGFRGNKTQHKRVYRINLTLLLSALKAANEDFDCSAFLGADLYREHVPAEDEA